MKHIHLLFLAIIVSYSCQTKPTQLGNQKMVVFDNTNLYFDMELKKNPNNHKDSILRLDAGRVLVKKVNLPSYQMQPSVTITTTLTSNGDPWDKSGSVFVIPASASASFLDLENKTVKKEQFQNEYIGIQQEKIDSNLVYKPNIELLRFMTPFGVGFFNNHEKLKDAKPVYIPKWEDNVVWKQDITHLLPLLENEVYIGVYVDTWNKQGYTVSVELDFTETTIPHHLKKERGVLPVLNTTKYAANQKFYDAFSKGNLSIAIPVQSTLKNAKLYYIATGHGGYAAGDEFNQKENIIKLNQKVIKKFTPWRDDCASFRRFNPSSGVAMIPTTYKGKKIEERIASSDYSRSNWCPGSDVKPEIIALGDLAVGTHTFEFAIPKAKAIEDNDINYWMVSAYITYDK
ncbi:PNGase F N-terminal domain-containing protein [Tenacibaculum tangerinum]|uniref:PNGase F N-terminal domain-containing protein n=1 Tax=Tenacibaculum tangerinum TaxID=3038772 RepID=A0ABY8L7G5_9FLAO|nr:PNGase F N-terminal domain-containing protein [Tenacibaculum tangerinum]WGH76323.1 PNGase F N-terminal domain-containing protein [Tenacibaculum tangerinum]